VHNDAEGLRRTADSLIGQKFDSIEWIVVDGCSTDGTLEIMSALSAHVDYSVSERDAGVYDAMQKGVSASSGAYICFLNAGDELLPNASSAMLRAIADAPSGAVLCGDWHCVLEDGRLQRPTTRPELLPKFMSVSHQASLIPRDAFVNHGGYDLRYRLAADFDLFLRLHLASVPFVRIPEALVRYYRGGLSDKRLFQSRVETIRTLWVNRSPQRLAGTWFYTREILGRLRRKLASTLSSNGHRQGRAM
jgi:glycosyltransferase involved in cell wall biosynthesis